MNKHGSILILSLWVLFFLAALAIAIGSYVSANIMQAERLSDRMELHALAKAGAEYAVMHCLNNTNEWDGMAPDLWNTKEEDFKDQKLEGGSFSVIYVTEPKEGQFTTNFGIIGENGRIDLNYIDDLPTNVFETLIENCGINDGGGIAKAIRDYFPKGLTGVTGSNYTFQSVEELLLVEGVSDEVFGKLSRHVTVYSGTKNININVADKKVLESLALKSDVVDAIIELRDGGHVFKDAQEIENDLRTLDSGLSLTGDSTSDIDVRSSAFRGTALAWLPEREKPDCKIEFVCDTDSGEFVYWREN